MKNIRDLLSRYISGLTWNRLWISLFAIGMGIFLIGMPKYLDDCFFLWPFGDWLAANGVKYPTDGVNPFVTGIPWDEILVRYQITYNTDNARIANILVIYFLLLPKWIGSLLCLILWLYVIIRTFEFCNINIKYSALVPIGLGLWYFLLPWENHMGSLVFQFNYIIPSAISIFILRRLYFSDCRYNTPPIMFVAGILCGAWNEAFSIPLMAGVTASLFICKSFRNCKVLILLTGLLTGLAWLIAAPGFNVRCNGLDYSYTEGIAFFIKRIIETICMHPSILILLGVELWVMARKGIQNVLRSKIMFLINVSAVCSLALSFVSTNMPRVAWWCDLAAVIGILYLLQKCYGYYWNQYSIVNIFICSLLLGTTGLSLALTDIYVIRTASASREIIDDFLRNPYGNVYNDWISGIDEPIMILSKFDTYPGGYLHLMPSFHISGSELLPGGIKVVPERLRSIAPNEGELLPGEGHVRCIDGYYVFEPDSVVYGQGRINIGLDNGAVLNAAAVVIPFTSEYDDKEYYLLRIFSKKKQRLFSRIIAMDTYRE